MFEKKAAHCDYINYTGFHKLNRASEVLGIQCVLNISKKLWKNDVAKKTCISEKAIKTMEISTFWPLIITTENYSVFLIFEKTITLKNHRKNIENTAVAKTLLKPGKYQHLRPLGWTHRTAPDDQNHPKGPPGPPPDTQREPYVFSVPFGPSPRTPWDLPRTSQGPPGPPKRHLSGHQGPPRIPKGRPRT